jgi:hypothetical protein
LRKKIVYLCAQITIIIAKLKCGEKEYLMTHFSLPCGEPSLGFIPFISVATKRIDIDIPDERKVAEGVMSSNFPSVCIKS